MNLALQDIRGWAWNCGAVPLPLLQLVLESPSDPERERTTTPSIVRKITTMKRNQQDASLYESVRQLLEELSRTSRLVVRLPKTLPALRREAYSFERIERDFYREFLRYGIGVAEVLPFAFKIGVFGLVKGEGGTYSKPEREELLDAWKEAALRAEENFDGYAHLFQDYLSGAISGITLVNRAADVFYGKLPHSRVLWNRIVDAVILSPNIAGLGVDLKKLTK